MAAPNPTITLTNNCGLNLRKAEVSKDEVKIVEDESGLVKSQGGKVTFEGPWPVLYQIQATAMNWYVYIGVEHDAGFTETKEGLKLIDKLTIIDWDDNEHKLECEVKEGSVIIRDQDASGWSCQIL